MHALPDVSDETRRTTRVLQSSLLSVKMQVMDELVVETCNGHLRGVKERSVEGFDYCAFKGVPYAKPPIGELRFKDPEPAENWPEIKDATKFGKNCPQIEPASRSFDGSEDCLYLNLYVRSLKNINIKKPVMVWIHGGAFTYYSGNDLHFGPDYLLRKDIILITFNYRLGIFGFLNLEDEIAPGNQGLKDQVMLLKWVQANVNKFGGDCNNVTVFGESAGAISAHYLALSPMTKSLLHKIICQSGTAFSPWGLLPDPKKYAVQLCNILGKYIYSSKEIFEFLKSVDSQRLVMAQEKVRKSYEKLRHTFPFIPTIDDKSPNPIIPIPGEEAAEQGVQIPCLLGYNNQEGVGFLMGIKNEVFDALDKTFPKMIDPRLSDLLKRYNLTTKDLRKLYFNKEKISHSSYSKLVDLFSDWKIIEGVHRAMKTQFEKSSFPTYAYKFCYNEKVTLCKALFQFPVDGAIHFEEVEYLFYSKLRINNGLSALKKGTPSYRLMEQMTEMWTNFAAFGTPTPKITELLPVEWLPLDGGINIRHLNIDKNLSMAMEENIEIKFSKAKSLLKK